MALSITCYSLRVALEAMQRKTPAGICLGMVSRKSNGGIKTRQRPFKLPPRQQKQPEVVMRSRVVGLQMNCPLVIVLCGIKLTQV